VAPRGEDDDYGDAISIARTARDSGGTGTGGITGGLRGRHINRKIIGGVDVTQSQAEPGMEWGLRAAWRIALMMISSFLAS